MTSLGRYRFDSPRLNRLWVWGRKNWRGGGDDRGIGGYVQLGSSDGDIICVGGDNLGGRGAVADEEVEGAGGNDGALRNSGVNDFVGCC